MLVARPRVARDAHAFARPILSALVRRGGVVIRHAGPAQVEILHLHRSRQCPRHTRGIRFLPGCRRGSHRPEPVERPHMAAASRRRHLHPHRLDARRELHPRLLHDLVRVPCARVRDGQQPGLVHAIDPNPELPAGPGRRHARFQRVGSGLAHVHRVFHPLARLGPAHHVLVSRPRVARDVHPFRRPVLSALVRRRRVVVRHAGSAQVEILHLHQPRQRPRHARGIRFLPGCRRGSHRPEPIERPHVAAASCRRHLHPHRLDARRQRHARLLHDLVGVPRPRVRDGQQPGLVHPVDPDSELPAGAHAGHTRLHRVGSRGGHVHRVFHPLARLGPAHHVLVSRPRVARDVHAFRRTILPALVRRCRVEIRYAGPAQVEILHLHQPWQSPQSIVLRRSINSMIYQISQRLFCGFTNRICDLVILPRMRCPLVILVLEIEERVAPKEVNAPPICDRIASQGRNHIIYRSLIDWRIAC